MSPISRIFFVLVVTLMFLPKLALAEGDAEAVAEADAVSVEGAYAGSEARTDTSGEGNLALHISGLQDVSGNVYIAVYDSADTWLSKDTLLEQRVVIADSLLDGLVQTTLQLSPGRYAMTVFYDRDDDGKLDTNFIGMPKEPIALSNNAKAKYGPPKFEDAAFELGEEPLLQTIDMEEL